MIYFMIEIKIKNLDQFENIFLILFYVHMSAIDVMFVVDEFLLSGFYLFMGITIKGHMTTVCIEVLLL